jgi:hypothetical protein
MESLKVESELPGNCYSFHIFLFPFKWEAEEQAKSSNSEKRKTHIESLLEKKIWEESKLNSDKETDYNEYKYFHSHIHSSIFAEKDDPLVRYLEFPTKGLTYTINVKSKKYIREDEPLYRDEIKKPIPPEFEDRSFDLTIHKVILTFYEEQRIGILSLHLINTGHSKPKDILLINQYGRRLYPPFLDKHYKDFKKEYIRSAVEGTIYRELPSVILIKDNKSPAELALENFCMFSSENTENIYIPKHISYFLGDEFAKKISPILDDRMFVMCWYGGKQLTRDYRVKKTPLKTEKDSYEGYILSNLCQRVRGGYEVSGFYRNDLQHRSLALNRTHDSYGYASNDFWYQYVFVDGNGTSCANQKLREEQIEKHTYSRWIEYNTLYGISRYSFVCVTEPKKALESPSANAGFIIDHIQTIYFRMVSLVLAQRAMVLGFSKEACDISKGLDKIQNEEMFSRNEGLLKKTDKLLVKYTDFIHRIFHREVTAQEQGIELYDMLQSHLRVEYQAKELEKELEELHRTAELILNRQKNRLLKFISILGGIFAIPSLVASFAKGGWFDVFEGSGNDDFRYWLLDALFFRSYECWWYRAFPHGKFIGVLLLMILVILGVFGNYFPGFFKEKISKKKIYWIIGISSVLFIIFYPALSLVLAFTVYSLTLTILAVIAFPKQIKGKIRRLFGMDKAKTKS